MRPAQTIILERSELLPNGDLPLVDFYPRLSQTIQTKLNGHHSISLGFKDPQLFNFAAQPMCLAMVAHTLGYSQQNFVAVPHFPTLTIAIEIKK